MSLLKTFLKGIDDGKRTEKENYSKSDSSGVEKATGICVEKAGEVEESPTNTPYLSATAPAEEKKDELIETYNPISSPILYDFIRYVPGDHNTAYVIDRCQQYTEEMNIATTGELFGQIDQSYSMFIIVEKSTNKFVGSTGLSLDNNFIQSNMLAINEKTNLAELVRAIEAFADRSFPNAKGFIMEGRVGWKKTFESQGYKQSSIVMIKRK